ncbi:VOC family protein [Nesterenkonia muleiensis]|uniref:VOC family protein n=1 Tax=Nesterenkonia muleiensis TaxID=2282648 RepID=UPI000E76A223|nr:VOC family protein [Nesterenkonia muleiensis]
MDFLRRTVVFDAVDVETEARFWAAVFDGAALGNDEWQKVRAPDGTTPVGVQYSSDHRSSHGWPEEPVRTHLDLWVADIRTAHRQIIAIGAEVIQLASGEQNWNVYLSPAGHPFCLVWDPQQ